MSGDAAGGGAPRPGEEGGVGPRADQGARRGAFAALTIAAHLLLAGLLLGSRALDAAILAAYAAYHAAVGFAFVHPRARLFGPNLSRLGTHDRVVALTFDDGPHPVLTPRVLDILRARGVRATFFLIGREAERHPEIARRITAEGHAVGNHSFAHSYLFWAWGAARQAADVARAQRAIGAAAGVAPRWFRAPVGLKNFRLDGVLRRQGLALVSWEVRFLDRAGGTLAGPATPAGRARPAGGRGPDEARRSRLARRLRRRLRPGAILALHDGHDRRPEGNPAIVLALPPLLDAIEALGYRAVTLDEGAGAPAREDDSRRASSR